MARRLSLGKQQYKAILTGIANPLKGLIQSWDEPLSICNGKSYICYQSESIKIQKKKSNIVLNEEDFQTNITFERNSTSEENEEENEEKSTPLSNNRYARIHFQFHPSPKLSLPEEYKLAINPNEYFQWSKQKCQDMTLSFNEDKLDIDFLNENGISILNQSSDLFSQKNFDMNKIRFKNFEKKFWLGENGTDVYLIQEETDLSPDDIEAMTQKHCILYYGKNNQFKTASNLPVFFKRRKFQVRLDKDLFPKFTKTDKIRVELRSIDKNIITNTPESFILKFTIMSKLYTAEVFISGICCL